MNDEKRCPQCGSSLPKGAPEGLCPACLLQRGLETRTAGTGGSPEVPSPTPEALAGYFPQLEIVELLGRGGMGAVYKARHKGLDRWVALKILPAAAQQNPSFAERFSREARALARLDHPNIVTVYDSGEVNGLYFFLMEYVDGANLRQVLAAGKMSPAQALAIVPQICDALQYAHDKGIVHRDIKPENILIDKTGRVKIADFGIAKIMGREARDFTLTSTEDVMGTPAYMAPEQVEHPSEVDHRADIYSLGVVFYQMLTGELPLGRFAPPSRKVHVDVRLDEVVLRALEKEPERRYQQAGEVKTEVETIAGSSGLTGTERLKTRQWNTPVNYRSKAILFGLPLVHITQGSDPATGRKLVARGIIAIGDIAQGVIAIGGCAMGGIALGGAAFGVISVGGLALGLWAFAGLALGLIGAWGGLALAPIAMGGTVMGYFAKGGRAIGMHVWDSIMKDPAAVRFFHDSWSQKFLNWMPIASPIFGFIVFAIAWGAIEWAKAREGRRTGRKMLSGWLQFASALLILALFGVSIAISWTSVHHQQQNSPAASQNGKVARSTEQSPIERFQATLQDAVDRKDKTALLALFNQEGIDAETKADLQKSILPLLDRMFSWPGVKVKCERRSDVQPESWERNGKQYAFNGKLLLSASFQNTDPAHKGQGPIFEAGLTQKGMRLLLPVGASQPSARWAQNASELGSELLSIHGVAANAGPDTKDYPFTMHDGQTETVYLEKPVLLDWLNVRSVKPEPNGNGGYSLRVTLDEDGTRQFAEITARRLEKRIGFVIDGKLLSAPVIKDPIFGGNFTMGNLSEQESRDLAAKLTKAIETGMPEPSATPKPSPSAVSGSSVSHPLEVTASVAHRGNIRNFIEAVGSVAPAKGGAQQTGPGPKDGQSTVFFRVPEKYTQAIVKKLDAGQKLTVDVYNNERVLIAKGAVESVENQIDPTTGTLECKARVVPNTDVILYPSQFVNVRLLLETIAGAIVIPVEAIQRMDHAAFVYIIEPDGTLRTRTVAPGVIDNGVINIESGISPEEMVATVPELHMEAGTKVRYKLPQADAAQIVQRVVETISRCSEGDPRVTEALHTLKPLDPAQVVSALVPFLDSTVPTVRRSAIYILYVGGLKPIESAIAPLEKLLTNPEDLTRGMAALALGTNKAADSFDALVLMAKNDASGYARRCAVYALGLLGNERAIPVLKAAQNDSDPAVRQNAQNALNLLARAPASPQETPGGASHQNDVPSAPSQDMKARAVAFVDLLAKGDFAKARAEFDATMSSAMSEQMLGNVWAQLDSGGGKYLGHGAPREEALQEYIITYVPCRWEKMQVDLKIVYNRVGKVSGLWVVPAGSSMLGNPPTPGSVQNLSHFLLEV